MFFADVIKNRCSICKVHATKFLKLLIVTSKETLLKKNIYLLRRKKIKRKETASHIIKLKELTEASTRGVLSEKMFLKILQNSQENACARVSFLVKLQTSGLQLY